jgi:hypothetical protein
MIIDDTAPSSAPQEQAVPTASLAIDGAEPQPGDEVEFTVRGKVTRSEGGKTFLTPTAINGEPLPEMPAEMTDESVRDAAEDADESGAGSGY